jgi:hypothetical protein
LNFAARSENAAGGALLATPGSGNRLPSREIDEDEF